MKSTKNLKIVKNLFKNLFKKNPKLQPPRQFPRLIQLTKNHLNREFIFAFSIYFFVLTSAQLFMMKFSEKYIYCGKVEGRK